MNEPSLTPAVVIGAGLVGASVGAALTTAGVEVHLIDSVSSHARVAASRGGGFIWTSTSSASGRRAAASSSEA